MEIEIEIQVLRFYIYRGVYRGIYLYTFIIRYRGRDREIWN